MFNKVLVAALLLVLAGCSDDQQVAKSSQPTQAKAPIMAPMLDPAGTPQATEQLSLVFFLDPNGRPCQMQNAILMEMAEELNGKVIIKYVQTTVPADRNLFYQYGVRALPTLLLADSSGNEIRRMPPGVKNTAAVRALIQSLPRS